jgi:hypothetical protein
MKSCNKVWNYLGRSLVAPALLLFLLLPSRGFGDTYGDFAYSVSGTNVTITGYSGSGGSVTIPSSIPNVGTVTAIGDDAFYDCTSLTNATIGNSVTSIGDYAFYHCYRLASVTIPNSVTSIGEGAFEWCSSLASVTIGNSVTSIGSDAFGYCHSLTNVTIPNSVTSIGNWAFFYCTRLASVYFRGNAPSFFVSLVFCNVASGFTIYYPATVSGWSTPTWNDYTAKSYALPPVLSLARGAGVVTPSFTDLTPGTNYQLQFSADLQSWSNAGAAFTATDTNQSSAQSFDPATNGALFFRLKIAQ